MKYVLSEICAKCNEICNMIKVLAPSMNVILMNEMLNDEAAKLTIMSGVMAFVMSFAQLLIHLIGICLVLCPKKCKLCRTHKEVVLCRFEISPSENKKNSLNLLPGVKEA